MNHSNFTRRAIGPIRSRIGLARRHRGYTLIDFMIVVTIAGILLGEAVPSFSSAFADNTLRGEANNVLTAIQHARMQTVARNEGVWFSVLNAPSGASCHLVHTGPAYDCSCADDASATCGASGTVLASGLHHPSVRASLAHSIRFDPRSGIVTPTGTVLLRSTKTGAELQARVAITGRVRTCTATRAMPGVAPC